MGAYSVLIRLCRHSTMARPPAKRRARIPRRKKASRKGSQTAGNGSFDLQWPAIRLPSQSFSTYRAVRSTWGSLPTIGSLDKGFAYSYAVSDMPTYAAFTGLFDQYMIESVQVHFLYNGGPPYPSLAVARDDDSAVVPPALYTVTQYANSRVLPFSPHRSSYTLKWKPPASPSTAVQTGLGGRGSNWVDCGTPSLPHYGLVGWGINYNTGLTGQGTINISETLTVLFRGQR